MNEKTIELKFWYLSPPLIEQLHKQGYTLSEDNEKRFEQLRRSWNHLRLNCIITESEANRSLKRLGKLVIKNAIRLPEVKA